jgi:hypothetical protein
MRAAVDSSTKYGVRNTASCSVMTEPQPKARVLRIPDVQVRRRRPPRHCRRGSTGQPARPMVNAVRNPRVAIRPA